MWIGFFLTSFLIFIGKTFITSNQTLTEQQTYLQTFNLSTTQIHEQLFWENCFRKTKIEPLNLLTSFHSCHQYNIGPRDIKYFADKKIFWQTVFSFLTKTVGNFFTLHRLSTVICLEWRFLEKRFCWIKIFNIL